MSIYRLATIAAERRPTFRAFDTGGTSSQASNPSSIVNSALSSLATYFPAEIMAIYLVGLSTSTALVADFPWFNSVSIYLLCLALTPIAALLIYFSLARGDAFFDARRWPWWTIISSICAFAAWGLAVPGAVIAGPPSGQLLAGFGAVIVAFLLELVGKAVANKISRKSKTP